MRTWTCETCGDVTNAPVDGVNVVEHEGHFYCAKCARIEFVAGSPVVHLPSPGRMHVRHATAEVRMPKPPSEEPRCGWCASSARDLGLVALTPIIDGNQKAHRCPAHLDDALIGGNVIPGTNNV